MVPGVPGELRHAGRGPALDDRVGDLFVLASPVRREVARLVVVVGQHHVVPGRGDLKIVAVGVRQGRHGGDGSGDLEASVEQVYLPVAEGRVVEVVFLPPAHREAAGAVGLEVHRPEIGVGEQAVEARHAVVVEHRHEGDAVVMPAVGWGQEQQPVLDLFGLGQNVDRGEGGRQAVHDVGRGLAVVGDFDRCVVVSVDRDTCVQAAGSGHRVVGGIGAQQRKLRAVAPGRCRDGERRRIVAGQRVVEGVGVERRIHGAAAGHRQG